MDLVGFLETNRYLSGRYDLEGAQVRLQQIENIFRVISCTDVHKVMLDTHMFGTHSQLTPLMTVYTANKSIT